MARSGGCSPIFSFRRWRACCHCPIGRTVAAFFFGAAFSNFMLTTSLFFAFAQFYPDLVIYFAYILPLKVKWIAWISAAILVLQIVVGSMQFRAAAICA